MLEPMLWDSETVLVPMSRAHPEDLSDIVAGRYGYEPGESSEDQDFMVRYAAVILRERRQP